ncbi:formin-like protein 3 [Rosa rugosa]|uniref:formin-like protein 3 n=1 Tax=Rosa rugosa TaxID=74645 RepID=UPI002B40477C|nr:formin-like protein 3 [Rosa rugosa]XP_062009517.1 formin-like protein 3 [Rosa rugosa]
MVIWEGMQMRRASYAVFVILLCALVIGASEGVRRTKETFYGGDWVSHEEEIDEDMAEQVWYHCRKELIGGTDGVEDLDLYIPQEAASDSETVFFSKSNIHDAILVLPPDVKQTLVDCLRKKGIVFHAPGKRDTGNNWLINHFEWLLTSDIAPRRYLASGSPKSKAPAAAPSLAPGPASKLSSGRAPPRSVLSPSPTDESDNNEAPAPSPSPPKQSGKGSPPPKPSGKVAASSPPAKPAKTKSPPAKPAKTNGPPSKDGSMSMIRIIGIAVAAVVIILLVVLPICCCCLKKRRRRRKVNPRSVPKDDRPLLYISSSGSSQISNSLGSSTREFNAGGKLGNLPMKNEKGNDSSEAKSEGTAGPPNPPVPPPPGKAAPPPPGPPPPPPLRPRPPPVPPKNAPKPMAGKTQIPPKGHLKANSGDNADAGSESGKTKLKPFFWDKVNANPDQSMVWHELKEGSFQFNEEKIESLFGYTKSQNERKKVSPSEPAIQFIQIIDKKKAQNLSILLRALNVTTEEVAEALREGNELPVELLQTLLKMAPTSEEELKLRLYTGDLALLGPAERFLKVMVEIPFAFKRMEALLFMCSFNEEVSNTKESFATLEVACSKLRKSRLFLKLLEAVLKTGNRMNDGTYRGGAQAFRLDTLLKLADVKGTDGKTTLLHFVVQEIIRYEGMKAARRARESSRSMTNSSMSTEEFVEEVGEESAEHYRNLGLQVVSGLSDELQDVKKAAVVDADSLTATVSNIGTNLIKARDFVNTDLKNNLDEDSEFHRALASFLERAEGETTFLLEEEKRITTLVKSTADYFHGNAMKDEGIRLFAIVRDFLVILNKVCAEIRMQAMKQAKTNSRKEALTQASPKKEALTQANSEKQSEMNKVPTEASSEKKEKVPTEASSEKKEKTPTEASSEKKEKAPTEASSEMKEKAPTEASSEKKEKAPTEASSEKPPEIQQQHSDIRRRLFPAIAELRIEDDFSSDDET